MAMLTVRRALCYNIATVVAVTIEISGCGFRCSPTTRDAEEIAKLLAMVP